MKSGQIVTLAIGGMLALMVLAGAGLMQPAYAQPGCFGTPTPNDDENWVQPPCPSLTPTTTPQMQSTPGIATPDDGGGPIKYNPTPGDMNLPVPVFPIISSPTLLATWTPQSSGTGNGTGTPNPDMIGTSVATVSSGIDYIGAMTQTPVGTLEWIDGSPFDPDAQRVDFEARILDLFSYIKGLDPDFWGKAALLLTMILIEVVWFAAIRALIMLLPVIAAAFRIIMRIFDLLWKAWQAFWEVLPG